MTLYTIDGEILTDIADALRGINGETKILNMSGMRQVSTKISKTSNAVDFQNHNGRYGNNVSVFDVITIPGATAIVVDMAYQTESINYDYVQVAAGEHATASATWTKYGGNTIAKTQLTFKDTDVITFYFKSDNSSDSFLGYYAECYGLDENGNRIAWEEYAEWEEEVPNTYKTEDMAEAISHIIYFSDEDLTFTGNCELLFAYDKWKPVIEREASRLFIDPTNARSLFQGCTRKDLSDITIECTSTSEMYASQMFADCYYLEKLPDVSGILIDANQGASVFKKCRSLADENELIKFFSNNKYQCGWPQGNNYFADCYSLRNINEALKVMGESFLVKSTGTSNNDGYEYSYMFSACKALDEIRNIPLSINEGITITSDKFYHTFHDCIRVKDIIFETNDGEPLVLTMSGQTIDLSSGVGYHYWSNEAWEDVLGYNSGITEDKRVQSDTDYQALKDDPNWFTTNVNYSRYNHDSAVNTINSLPDTSAYLATAGGTNTIKFRKISGYMTDGGAIENLTEEEIAVAAAKGWTVSFVS